MSFEEVALVSLAAVSCVGICAWAYVQAQIRTAIIQQQGIDRRAIARGGNDPAHAGERAPWWGELVKAVLPELLKSPAVQEMITKNAPALIEKFTGGKQD